MFLKAHPERGKSEQDKAEMERVYKPGDNVIPTVQVHDDSDDSEDERALAEARALSLNDTEQNTSERRRAGASAQGRHRRRHDVDRPSNTYTSYGPEDLTSTARPSNFLAQRRQLDRQSSLRSLMSASDLDSADMEEEIMRQIIDEGLLDGVDLNSLSPAQEEEITERIASAFRACRRGQHRQQPPASSGSARSPASRHRQHAGSTSSATRETVTHPHLSRSHLLASAAEGDPRRRQARTSSQASQRSVRSVASASAEQHIPPSTAHTSTRSTTDLSQQPREEANSRPNRTSQASRRTTDPVRRTENRSESRPLTTRPRVVSDGRNSLDLVHNASEARTEHHPAPFRSIVSPSNNSTPALPTLHALHLTLPSDIQRPTSSSAAIPSSSTRPVAPSHGSRLPSVTCGSCEKPGLEHSLHYNCSRCSGGDFDLCLDCYRAGKGCHHWYGFGYAAFIRYQRSTPAEGHAHESERPHILSARRFAPTSGVLEEGLFCEGCFSFANSCYWHCDVCNEGAWGYCNACVQQGKHCTHPLESVGHIDTSFTRLHNPASSTKKRDPYPAPLSTRKAAFHFLSQAPTATMTNANLPHVPDPSLYTPLTLTSYCDNCHESIPPSHTRLHCHECSGGDYDLCTPCYHALVRHGDIAAGDSLQGWRRCPRRHRMSVIGFEDREGGPKRLVVKEVVGGWALKEDQNVRDQPSQSTPKWLWKESDGTAASVTSHLMTPQLMPPDGGVGLRAHAMWSYFPSSNAQDELAFPRNAIILEVEDINGDWFWGVYAGRKGLFPGNYVKVI